MERNFAGRTLFHADNLPILRGMNSETVDLIAADPPFNKGRDKARFRRKDPDGRLWSDCDISAKWLSGGGYEYEYKGIRSLWRVPLDTMKRLDAEGRQRFAKSGGIRRKRCLDEMKGRPAQALWDDINAINSQARERVGCPTRKPIALYERIIRASSNPGDMVLDPFRGCAATPIAAERLGRQWVGIGIRIPLRPSLAFRHNRKSRQDEYE